ncbi:AAA family ATPase [Bacillus piscicola]|uniref:AAA family ATPase n=1 Tax=Bacillus piscicola TaxID=1632684 RepID=UPI001F09BD39|nr:hypothetical protein [Bacillus piscicola]
MAIEKLHLVFPTDGNILDNIASDLEEIGYPIVQKDSSLDTMVDWAQSTAEESADCALIYGLAVTSKEGTNHIKEAVYQHLKNVRFYRENLRLIVMFPEMIKHDKEFISKIAQLMIYDIHFNDSIDAHDLVSWINQPKGFQYVERLLTDYKATDEEEEISTPNFYETEEEEFEDGDTLEEKFRKRKIRDATKSTRPKKPLSGIFSTKEKNKEDSNDITKNSSSSETDKKNEPRQYNILKNISEIAVQFTNRQTPEIHYEYRSFSSKVMVVTGTKGGIGKTDVTINLAAALKEHTFIDRICIVDLGFPYGSIAAALDLNRTSNVSNWRLASKKVTEEGLKNMVVSREGMDFIPLPLNIRESFDFQVEHAGFMIDVLKNFYDVILVDTAGFTPVTKLMLERATDIIMLVTHDVASISQCLALKEDIIRSFGIDYEKISIFLNQVPKTEDISKGTIAEALEDSPFPSPIIAYAPYDDMVRRFRNRGEWIYYEKPHHSFSLGIDMVLDGLGLMSDSAKRQKRKGKSPSMFQGMLNKS